MARYALRNKERIRFKLGTKALETIIKALNQHFAGGQKIEFYKDGKYQLLNASGVVCVFISKKYDVYKIAFLRFR